MNKERAAVLIEASLEQVAEQVGDPAEQVYRRLFAQVPELEELFVRDRSGTVRGEMLHRAIETILDLVGTGHYARGLITSEWINHQNLGVPGEKFELFFAAIVDTFRDIMAERWTDETDQAWRWVQAQARELIVAAGQGA